MVRSEERPAAQRKVVAPVALDALTQDDVAGGLALSDAAGWNQTADDWTAFIASGHALGVRDAGGRLVATAATLRYGAQAWISMVLVAAAERHRGLASALMDRCVADLRADGVRPVLDATSAGAAVYRRIGFVDGFGFRRWQSTGKIDLRADHTDHTEPVDPARRDHRDAIARLDRASSGLERRFLLDAFLARPRTRAWLAADGAGFVIAREGRRAWQVGPLVAVDDARAIALLAAAFDTLSPGPRGPSATPVFIDIPDDRRVIADWLSGRGFEPQRPFVRMALGPDAPASLDARCVALAGPEFG